MSSSSTSTSKSIADNYKYHVFLSFRGQDTRNNFIDHLYKQLKLKGIHVFKDDKELDRGKFISPSLLQAIEESRACIVVISQNYASSSWCLDELVKIMECGESKGMIVLPVFYKVDIDDVDEVRGKFKEDFDGHEERFKEEMQRVECWRRAFVKVASISGWDSRLWPESELVDEIVKDLLKKLNQVITTTSHSMDLIGIDKQIEEVESLLCLDLLDVRILGIWGMGGIGKTTIARVVFNRIGNLFEGCYFLADFKKKLEEHSVFDLQTKLVSSLLDASSVENSAFNLGHAMTKDRLQRKRVLIVLDNVDSVIQLQELLPISSVSFCPGSRILVTSRDKQVLKSVTNMIYEVEKLNCSDALELFSLKAFKKNYPSNDYLELSRKVVNYAKGNPLALIVSGCALFDRSKEVWESAMKKLGEVLDPQIQQLLRISFDSLDPNQKQIFLDIACFYRGAQQDNAKAILAGSFSSVEYDIHVLIDKSLVTIYHNTIEMHDLIQEMGRSVVREESTKREKRSRLWDSEDVSYVLRKRRKKGTEAIEGIFLDLSTTKEMHLQSNAFDEMENLRLLKFYAPKSCTNFKNKLHLPHHGLDFLSHELRYLQWDGFPSRCLPIDFCAENLVELSLRNSEVEKLWDGVQDVVNLKWMDLSYSENLTEIPDLSLARNMKSIYLESCTSLVEIHYSIQNLDQLEILFLDDCANLTSLPARIDSKFLKVLSLYRCKKVKKCPELLGDLKELCLSRTAVTELPKSIRHLKFVKNLALGGCSKIIEFPEIPSNTEKLSLPFTAIERVPSSIKFLMSLVTLDLRHCCKLSTISSDIFKLKSLKNLCLLGCSELESFPDISEPSFSQADPPSCLKRLTLCGCKKFVSFPKCIDNLRSLEHLDASCTKCLCLHPLKGLSCLTTLDLGNCNLLEIPNGLLSSMISLRILTLEGNYFQSIPVDIIQLSELERLDIHSCRNLHSLPDLPLSLKYLHVNNCTELETLSFNKHLNLEYLSFMTCFKLDQRACSNVSNVLELAMQVCGPPRKFLLPGSELPEWFRYRSTGSSLTIQLPSNWNRCKAIAFCVVFAPKQVKMLSSYRFCCKCSVKAFNCELNLFGRVYTDPIQFCELDHVAIWCSPVHASNRARSWYSDNESCSEATFEFNIKPGLWELKKCGILLICSDEEETSDDDSEFELFDQ